MQRAKVFLPVALVFLALVLMGCDVLGSRDRPEVDLTEIFPAQLPPIGQAKRLNVMGDREKEWLVFYHVDEVKDDKKDSPIAAAVYRSVTEQDSRLPPRLIPELLWLPGQAYLCFHTCEAEMRDVISGDPKGKELVIQDKLDDDTVGVAIFYWREDLPSENKTELGGFVPLGHFRGDSIEIKKDQVAVIHKYNDRSGLAVQEIYEPQAGRYYVHAVQRIDDASGQLRSPQEARVIFANGLPKEPTEVKLPEKLVLAFYEKFDNLNEIESYVTPAAWDNVVRGCPENICGCASKREDVSRVIVKQIAYPSDLGPKTQVVVQVICVNKKSGNPEPKTTLTWGLDKQPDNTWLLTDVFPGGDGHLCPPLGCQLLGSRE